MVIPPLGASLLGIVILASGYFALVTYPRAAPRGAGLAWRMSADPFGHTDQLEPAMLDAIAARLENRGRHPAFTAMLKQYLDAMGIDAAASVLDLGCGTGLAAREIARRKGFRGHVTGI